MLKVCTRCARDCGWHHRVNVTDEGVTVSNWWRWVLRGLAVIALVVGGVLLVLHPHSASMTCLSPFNRITGSQLKLPTGKRQPPSEILAWRAAVRECSAATNGREHIVETLGAVAIVLVGLSFLRRRRPVGSALSEAAS
jgi:hypothetical protein